MPEKGPSYRKVRRRRAEIAPLIVGLARGAEGRERRADAPGQGRKQKLRPRPQISAGGQGEAERPQAEDRNASPLRPHGRRALQDRLRGRDAPVQLRGDRARGLPRRAEVSRGGARRRGGWLKV